MPVQLPGGGSYLQALEVAILQSEEVKQWQVAGSPLALSQILTFNISLLSKVDIFSSNLPRSCPGERLAVS